MQLIIVDHASRISCFFDHFSTPFLVVHLTSIDHLVLMVALGPSSPFTQRNVKPFGFCIPSAHGLVATSVPLQWRHLGAAAVGVDWLECISKPQSETWNTGKVWEVARCEVDVFFQDFALLFLSDCESRCKRMLWWWCSLHIFSDKLRPFYVIYV